LKVELIGEPKEDYPRLRDQAPRKHNFLDVTLMFNTWNVNRKPEIQFSVLKTGFRISY